MKRYAYLFALIALGGCTGLTLGENEPGGDVWLEPDTTAPDVVGTDEDGRTTFRSHGSIAVDPSSETIYLMQSSGVYSEGIGSRPEPGEQKVLHAINPETMNVETVVDVSTLGDVRVAFPRRGLLVMGESGSGEVIRTFDYDTHEQLEESRTSAHYNGLRLSGEGRFLAAADNPLEAPAGSAPIHVIDTENLSNVAEIPHDGDWLEAMWTNTGDRLIAIVFYDTGATDDSSYARILSWDLHGGMGDEVWDAPTLDIRVDHTLPDFFFSFTWIGIHPQDAYAVLPVRSVLPETGDEGYHHTVAELLITDLETGDIRRVRDAKGPVGFTPDGSTIVSYRDSAPMSDGSALVLIDIETLEETVMPVPHELPSYFVSRQGNFVVLASSVGDESLLIYDVNQGEMNEIDGPGIVLHEFVSRRAAPELWLVDDGLYRLDFMGSELAQVDPGFTPAHVNILPQRDLLVLDERGTPNIHLFSPESETVVGTTMLPTLMSAE